MNQNLKMAFRYLEGWKNDIDCQEGNHKWSETSAYTRFNVAQAKEKNDYSCHRHCLHCNVEMPKSAQDEENYISWENKSDWNFKQILANHTREADYINETLNKLTWYNLIWIGFKKLWKNATM